MIPDTPFVTGHVGSKDAAHLTGRAGYGALIIYSNG